MSYSIQVREATKQEAKDAIFVKLSEVSEQQPHKGDSKAANMAACAYIDMLVDDPAKDIIVQVCGCLICRIPADLQADTEIATAQLTISAAVVDRITI